MHGRRIDGQRTGAVELCRGRHRNDDGRRPDAAMNETCGAQFLDEVLDEGQLVACIGGGEGQVLGPEADVDVLARPCRRTPRLGRQRVHP